MPESLSRRVSATGGVAGWETVLVPYARRLSDEIESRARSSAAPSD